MKRNILLKTLTLSILLLLSCETEPIGDFVEDVLENTDQIEDEEQASDEEQNNDEQSDENQSNEEQSEDENTDSETPEFAMTANINETSFMANNPFGNNEFSNTNIFNYYPIEDFVLLQGREGGQFGQKEINLWLKREDIVVGSYQVTYEYLGLTPPTHYISLTDNTNSIAEQTKEGTITITEVNSSTKTVIGTFEFTTVNDDEFAPVDFTVTNGTFHYKYE